MTGLEIFLILILAVIVLCVLPYLKNLLRLKSSIAEKMEYLSPLLPKNGVVFLGDSLTEFYPTDEFFSKVKVINRGIASDTTEDVLERIEDVYALQPSKLFLLIGTNDMGQGKTNKYIVNNIKKIIELITEKVPEVKIYVISEYPVSKSKVPMSYFFCGLRNNKRLDKINAELIKYCQEKGYTYIDLNSKLKKGKAANNEYMLEGLHLTVEGYKVVTEVLKPYVEE